MNKNITLFFLISVGLLLIVTRVIAQVSDYEKANLAFNRGDYKTSYNLIRPLAKKGFAQAQYSLGIMYEKGKGVDLNLKKAKKWFKLSAQQGISKAQFKLGLIYRNGQGGEKNYSKAIKWWELAANKGNANAQINLGLIFENGLGVPQDYNKAIRLYSLAAGAGNTKAQKYLNSLLNKKVEAQINFGLGVRFENGQGVVRDYNEAIRWYNLAANLGFDKGKEKRDLLLSKMKNSKEIPTGAKDLISLEEEKSREDKDLQIIEPSLESLKGQIKPEKMVETAKLADTKTRQGQLQKAENNNFDSNAGNISIPTDKFDKYSLVSKVIYGMGLKSLGKKYNDFFNKFWKHYHYYDREGWIKTFERNGLKMVNVVEYGKSKDCLFNDIMVPFTLPNYVVKKLFNRWFLFVFLRRIYSGIWASILKPRVKLYPDLKDGGLIFFALTK